MNRFFKIGLPVAALGAVLAVSTPLGASAAALIDSGDIKDQTIQSRDIGTAGVGTDEIRNQSIVSGDIASQGVGTSEIRQGTVGLDDLSARVKAEIAKDKTGMTQAEKDAYATKGHANAVAQDAENAAKGYADANDDKGINTARAGAGYTTFAKPGVSVAFNKCDVDGQVAISGGYRLNGHAAESFSGSNQAPAPEGLSVIAVEPAAVVNGELVNSYQHPDVPQTEDGAFQANAIAVTFNNTTGDDLPVRVFATCVSPN